MFELRKEMKELGISSQQVRRLYRSLGDVQIALPGHPSQQATAYLCAYAEGKGFRVAVALHLHASEKVAYYLNPKANLGKEEVRKILDEGTFFAETMGFMLGDLDYHRLDPNAREALWSSLPLSLRETAPPAPPSPESLPSAEVEPEPEEIAPLSASAEDADSLEDDWLDLAGLSSIQTRKKEPPSPEELQASKEEFLQNLGRLLSSF